jgi:hypothetical protein
LCVPASRADQIITKCEELFRSVRRYTAVEVAADRVVLAPRARILRETPIDGCLDSAQCMALSEDGLSRDEAAQGLAPASIPRRSYSCEADPSRGGPNRCVMTCESDDDCIEGTICGDGGRCVLGPVPTQDCLETLQRYSVHAGESFVVVGSVSGYHHGVIEDPVTGACILDPTGNPLLVGRFRADEPPCDELTPEVTSPNPCRITGFTEPLAVEGGFVERPTWAIRFRGPGLATDFVDVATRASDKIAPGQWYVAAPASYQLIYGIAGAFVPFMVELQAHIPQRIVTSTNGALWVIDSGEGVSLAAGDTDGQMIQINLASNPLSDWIRLL